MKYILSNNNIFMSFWIRLKNDENIKRLFLFLWTDEQQEFLERAKLLEKSKENFFNETALDALSNEEYENEDRYNLLLDKSIVLSRMSIEDRLWFLLLTDEDQEDYIELYLKMRSILDSDSDWEDDTWDYEINLKKYDLLHEKMKSRYTHRSLLK
jgi:hypothetical protein